MSTAGDRGYAALVATFRRPESLGTVLDSILGQTTPPTRVVVVDNDPAGSARAVVDAAQAGTEVPIELVVPGENLGPAGGWALACEAALAHSPVPYVVVVDDDDPVGGPTVVARQLDVLGANPGIAAVGLRGATLDRRRCRLHRRVPATGETVTVDYVASNGVPVYRVAALPDGQLFDSSLFFGFEDLDRGLDLVARGWELHAVGLDEAAAVADTAPGRDPWREYFKVRALVTIARRRLSWTAVVAIVVRSALLGGVKLALTEGTVRPWTARIAGVRDGVRGRLGTQGRAPAANDAKTDRSGPRVLLVCGVDGGGAPRSTIELSTALRDAGVSATALIGRRPRDHAPLGLALRAQHHLAQRPSTAAGAAVLRCALRRWGGRTVDVGRKGRPEVRTRLVEYAVARAATATRATVVVVSSLPPQAMRRLRAELAASGTPVVLYLRSAQDLVHLDAGHDHRSVVANSQVLAHTAAATIGAPVAVVASAVETTGLVTEPTRRVALLVNPLTSGHVDLLAGAVQARPDIPFVIQGAWEDDLAATDEDLTVLRGAPNVEIRPVRQERSQVYADARVLLATYPSGRPRVIVEAQACGIPVVGVDHPGVREAVAGAGVLVEPDASVDRFVAALGEVWDDAAAYASLVDAARRAAHDSPTRPDRAAAAFIDALGALDAAAAGHEVAR